MAFTADLSDHRFVDNQWRVPCDRHPVCVPIVVRIPVSHQDVRNRFPLVFRYEAAKIEQPQILTRIDRNLDLTVLNQECIVEKVSDPDITPSLLYRLRFYPIPVFVPGPVIKLDIRR